MKLPSGLLIAALVIACAIALGAYRWYHANTVFANEPGSTSEFFRTYDPGPVIKKYGTERQTSSGAGSSSGWHEATRMRDVNVTVALPANQVADLTAALRNDIEARLRAQAHLIGWGESSGEYTYEYESGHAWGLFILERLTPELSSNCAAATTWVVRMRFIERWHK